ncbi:A disintegrin and metalloproteinase with thrombospondin motifs 3-like [Strongylocentrotus purpuratus]|uniref:Peptidase M12B domain-containing protein n=1 Tax=Strongylocentrotus purpuratus TaxID=7668 RepID=A0A7M7T4T1_STRPU|nr:A disintegrin and metalloproteinase with thrombospondin motifs 3-like [Strongylocentrotus purpuratus]
MAHETGHSLGLNHDGTYGCAEGRNIMSASLPSSTGAFEWSTCSSEHMKISISSEVCMDDVPIFDLSPIDDLPGLRYSADMQCQMELSIPTAHRCTFLTTSCTKLWCSVRAPHLVPAMAYLPKELHVEKECGA